MLKSYSLRYGKVQMDEIRTHVREILRTIDDCIKEAHDKCQTGVNVPLPYNFDISNLTKAESRKKIYVFVIEDLTSPERGFTVHLKIGSNNTASLDISWFTEEDEMLRIHEDEIFNYYKLDYSKRSGIQRPKSIPFEERIKQYTSKNEK